MFLDQVMNSPGNQAKVIMGGGYDALVPYSNKDKDDAFGGRFLPFECERTDRLNLINTWKEEHENSVVALSKHDLDNVDVEETEYLMGIFSRDHLPYEDERNSTLDPSLTEMTEKALEASFCVRAGHAY